MEPIPHSEESSHYSADEAAHDALLYSDLPITDENASLVAEVAAVAGETGLVEASKMADTLTDTSHAEGVVRAAGRLALQTGTVDRLILHDYVVLLTTGHSGEYYQERRRSNKIRRQAFLEASIRKHARSTPDS